MAKRILLSLLALYSLFFILSGILPPVLIHFKIYNLSAELTYLMSSVCHQQPTRSFWILGYPMSLCSRCIGVYLGFFFYLVNELQMPLKARKRTKQHIIIMILLIISLIDIILNFLLNFDTGLIMRFIAGIFIGICLAYFTKLILDIVEKGIKKCLQKK